MTLYTYAEAARLLALPGGRATIHHRLGSLAARGEALTVEAGELQPAGEHLLITELGLERLRAYRPGKRGPDKKPRRKRGNRQPKESEQ